MRYFHALKKIFPFLKCTKSFIKKTYTPKGLGKYTFRIEIARGNKFVTKFSKHLCFLVEVDAVLYLVKKNHQPISHSIC